MEFDFVRPKGCKYHFVSRSRRIACSAGFSDGLYRYDGPVEVCLPPVNEICKQCLNIIEKYLTLGIEVNENIVDSWKSEIKSAKDYIIIAKEELKSAKISLGEMKKEHQKFLKWRGVNGKKEPSSAQSQSK